MPMIDVNVDNYPTIQAMIASQAYVKIVIGPAGSAKTSGCIKELMLHSMMQAPNSEGIRYTRWLIVRNTYNLLKSNTIPSMKNFLGGTVDFTMSAPPKGHGRIPLPDGTSMDVEFEFLSLDSEDAVNKLLGAEPTGAFLDEVSELEEIVVDAVVGRVGRYPSNALGSPSWIGVLGATNGPNESHWLHEWSEKPDGFWSEIEHEIGRPYFELFQQPPALIRPVNVGDPWEKNPAAENIENLKEGYGYYYKMLLQSDERVIAYVEGKFSPLKSGQVIFPEYKKALHEIHESKVVADKNVITPIMLSFDFGRTPVCLVGQVNKYGGILITEETVGVDMGIATLWDTVTKPHIKQTIGAYTLFGAYGDPSGKAERDTLDLSPFSILEERGVPIDTPWGESNAIDLRLEAVRRRLKTLDPEGRPMLMVSSKCKLTIMAFQKGYVWENKSTDPDKAKDTPTKSHKNHVSDIMDGVQYMCLGFDAEFIHGKAQDKRIKPKGKGTHKLRARK